ncbi:hypothetical protein TWF481_008866 [Arthrobotrys musiformis]|uniref:Uncharacterized protein n=1 Tax=Arthrobotrys musiformis TaxID=47236 RepID=A0AAV9WE76_9PEZI
MPALVRNLKAARHFQRVLVFVAPNEIGGHAYLYRMLKTTRHPLYIVYAIRRSRDATLPFLYVQKSEEFKKALAETDSTMSFYEMRGPISDLSDPAMGGRDWVSLARDPILRCSRAHGERPISYIFINGHPNFGHRISDTESNTIRQGRLAKYWAPYLGALHNIARPDMENGCDRQAPWLSAKWFTIQMSSILTALLPLVRNDGEGVVVLKTPADSTLNIIRSREMRASFAHPTPYLYESAVRSLREATEILRLNRGGWDPMWPEKEDFLGVGDVFAKSAITMYKSFTPFENITFHRCGHDYDDINGPVSLLMDPKVPKPASAFTKEDLAFARRDLPTDLRGADVQKNPISRDETLGGNPLIRWTSSPDSLPHNLNRPRRIDWITGELTQGPQTKDASRPLIRSAFADLAIDKDVPATTRYSPFNPRAYPPIQNPKKGPQS